MSPGEKSEEKEKGINVGELIRRPGGNQPTNKLHRREPQIHVEPPSQSSCAISLHHLITTPHIMTTQSLLPRPEP